MDNLPKIYCFINSEENGWLDVVALAEDGHCITSHFSSTESWAKHDIGINSNWKHDEYQNYYPNGYELEWVERKDLHTHEGLLVAVKKNSELLKENEK